MPNFFWKKKKQSTTPEVEVPDAKVEPEKLEETEPSKVEEPVPDKVREEIIFSRQKITKLFSPEIFDNTTFLSLKWYIFH